MATAAEAGQTTPTIYVMQTFDWLADGRNAVQRRISGEANVLADMWGEGGCLTKTNA